MYCRKCGKQIDDEAVVCVHCGVATKDPEAPAQAQQPVIHIVNNNTNTNTNVNANNINSYVHKKKWTAFWLCLFLGWAGAHRFYVGKAGTGILWLLTGGIGGIGWILDLIVILCGGFRDKAGQPLV